MFLESSIGHESPACHVTTSTAVIPLALCVRANGSQNACTFLNGFTEDGSTRADSWESTKTIWSAVVETAEISTASASASTRDHALTVMIETASATGDLGLFSRLDPPRSFHHWPKPLLLLMPLLLLCRSHCMAIVNVALLCLASRPRCSRSPYVVVCVPHRHRDASHHRSTIPRRASVSVPLPTAGKGRRTTPRHVSANAPKEVY